MDKKKFYITTAIAYASRKPHFGNTYEVIMTDAIARYKRQRGYDVFFLTGTDEHGQKIEELAKASDKTPKEYVDGVSAEIKQIWDSMGASYDKFIRTTDDDHKKSVEHIFKRLYEQGDIYKDYYEGWYCTPCESFFTDTQAVDCKCPDCGRPVQKTKEEAYFFKMSKYAPRLIQYIEDNPDFIQPESRRKEMVNNFLKVEGGLQDLCVSRTSFKWGVPVTFDDKHVIYVWIDALSNYITALGYDPELSKQPERFKKYWPADVHIIGKDILRFHTIYWPIMLMALGIELPKKVFGHPWFNFGTDKMSKSKGNVIYADYMAEHFGVDGVRYYALSEMPFASDGSITYESVIARFNNDLVNNLGNLVKRTLDMVKKYNGYFVPTRTETAPIDDELVSVCVDSYNALVENMDNYRIADALENVFSMLRRANKYIDETTPWTLAKDEGAKARLDTVLYNLLEVIRWGAVMLLPFIPASAKEILEQIGTEFDSYETIGSAEKFGMLKAGNSEKVGESKVLFARIDEAKLLEKLEADRKASIDATKADTPEKPEGVAQIGIDAFMNVELRSAQVIACEKVPKANKLLKLTLDLGYEQRTVASGIAKFYSPEELIGKKLIVVANLKPAVLCGIESNGMILACGEEKIRVVFLSDDTPLGERVR